MRKGFQRTRVNDVIRAAQVRVVDEAGEQLGVKERSEALSIAKEKGLDLVEVAPQASPPVCRIMDYGKYKYEQEQRAKRAKKHQVTTVVKEIKMRPKIDPHDFETKKKHVVRFLEHGDRVKVTIMFRGRELTHPEIGRELLKRLADEVAELGKVETSAKLDGRDMVMVLNPIVHPHPKDKENGEG
ncbi:MAG: translation initiation factor IF-3 [Terriglobia bacterium]